MLEYQKIVVLGILSLLLIANPYVEAQATSQKAQAPGTNSTPSADNSGIEPSSEILSYGEGLYKQFYTNTVNSVLPQLDDLYISSVQIVTLRMMQLSKNASLNLDPQFNLSPLGKRFSLLNALGDGSSTQTNATQNTLKQAAASVPARRRLRLKKRGAVPAGATGSGSPAPMAMMGSSAGAASAGRNAASQSALGSNLRTNSRSGYASNFLSDSNEGVNVNANFPGRQTPPNLFRSNSVNSRSSQRIAPSSRQTSPFSAGNSLTRTKSASSLMENLDSPFANQRVVPSSGQTSPFSSGNSLRRTKSDSSLMENLDSPFANQASAAGASGRQSSLSKNSAAAKKDSPGIAHPPSRQGSSTFKDESVTEQNVNQNNLPNNPNNPTNPAKKSSSFTSMIKKPWESFKSLDTANKAVLLMSLPSIIGLFQTQAMMKQSEEAVKQNRPDPDGSKNSMARAACYEYRDSLLSAMQALAGNSDLDISSKQLSSDIVTYLSIAYPTKEALCKSMSSAEMQSKWNAQIYNHMTNNEYYISFSKTVTNLFAGNLDTILGNYVANYNLQTGVPELSGQIAPLTEQLQALATRAMRNFVQTQPAVLIESILQTYCGTGNQVSTSTPQNNDSGIFGQLTKVLTN